MRCIYFTGEECEAAPYSRLYYKPDQQVVKDRCEGNFSECPRFRAFIDYVRAASKQTH